VTYWQSGVVVLALSATLIVASGCGGAPRASRTQIGDVTGGRESDVTFVRGGIVVDRGDKSQVTVRRVDRPAGDATAVAAADLPEARQFVPLEWSPLATYQIARGEEEWTVRAPVRPTPHCLWRLTLEDVRRVALAGAAPDAVVRFSPDARYLAVGSFGGWLRVVEVASGRVVDERRVAEGMVKQLAWSPDAAVLYVGEQSPDGNLLALDATTAASGLPSFEVLWQRPLADDVETSRPPSNDRYGIYTLPGVFDIEVSRDGRLFVTGTHSWTTAEGVKNRSVVLALSSSGKLLWRYPPERAAHVQGAAHVVVPHLSIDPEGTRLAFWASQSQAGAAQAADTKAIVEPDTVNLIDAASGALLDVFAPQPLPPYFVRAESWDSLAVSTDARRLALGLSDGRVLLFDIAAGKLVLADEVNLATPLVAGEIPYAAPASFARAGREGFVLQTQNTFVPDVTARGAAATVSPHHGANTLTVVDNTGAVSWRYRGPTALGGVWLGGDGRIDSGDADANETPGRLIVVACRARPSDLGRGDNGFLLFDTNGGGGGSDRLVYRYPTDGAPLFHADISRDGRWIAIIEAPTLTADGESIHGSYQVHIVH
jgi:hypothetical protein